MKRVVAAVFAALVAVLSIVAIPASAQGPAATAGNSSVDPAMRDLSQEQQKRAIVQPGNNSPVWREVRAGQPAYASVPGREMNVLVQNEGQEWRALRNGFWVIVSGWAVVGMLLVLSAIYFTKGTIQLEQPETGRKLLRFTQWQRWVHWTVAVAFTVLACSGLIMLFGKNLVLPIIGYTLFSWLAMISKNLHNFIGPLFVVSILILVVTFARENIPQKGDVNWFLKLGGFFSKSGHEPPSGKFNAGEKLWFWGGALFLGLIVGGSGLVMNFPNFDQTRATMQLANIIHLIAASLFLVFGMAHAYLGTLGMAGAYEGMKTGVVDEQWAREHHEYWYEDIKAGRVNADPARDGPHGHPVSGSAD
jgi:formate dehydrogenase subunit gamma